MRINLLDVLTSITAGAALLVAGLVVWERSHPQAPYRADRPVDDWSAIAAVGYRLGPNDAPVRIVEFGDYECPACRQLHNNLKPVLDAHPDDVQFIFRHYPLDYHAHARTAALAAECAGDQGSYFAYHDAMYENPGYLGDWDGIAERVKIPDVAAFETCLDEARHADAIERDRRAVDEIGATGTPTVIVNGIYLGRPPNTAELEDMVMEAKQGGGN